MFKIQHGDVYNLNNNAISETGVLQLRMREKRNSQCEHGQPMEHTRGLFCTCNSGMARCQSQHQCHFWRMNAMFEAYCTGKCKRAKVFMIP